MAGDWFIASDTDQAFTGTIIFIKRMFVVDFSELFWNTVSFISLTGNSALDSEKSIFRIERDGGQWIES